MAGPAESRRPVPEVVLRKLESLARTGERSVRFDRFMEAVLYDPEFGYYERPERVPGPRGDFVTAVQLRPLFARTLAARILAEFDRLGRPDWFRVLDVGAGAGQLAADVIAELSV